MNNIKLNNPELTDKISHIPMVHMVEGELEEKPILRRIFYAPTEDELIEKVTMASLSGQRNIFVYSVYTKQVYDKKTYFVDMGFNPLPGDPVVW